MKCLIIGSNVDKYAIDNLKQQFQNECIRIGQFLYDSGHSLIICSPFKDSADYWVLKGFIKGDLSENQTIELYFVDNDTVQNEIKKIESELGSKRINKIPHPAPKLDHEKSIRYSWLLCQLEALETCHFIIAVGGKIDGSANMLLLLAESKGKLIVPLSFLGGAASQSFNRRRYELKDKLGIDYLLLQDGSKILNSSNLNELLSTFQLSKNSIREDDLKSLSFFISYPRTRPAEADYIETLLRRRNLKVFRDESDFGAGSSIPLKITETIHSSNIFIAIWCTEYACSPWCFDEFELALDRSEAGKMELWIFCIDGTRMVPKRARKLNYYKVSSRDQIEGMILNLIERK